MGAQTMHQDFAQWYGVVSFGDNESTRQKRWGGVSNVVENADRKMLETLLRLAFASRQTPSSTDIQAVRQLFKEADEAFEMHGNERELQVLAGASLATLMQCHDAAMSHEAALAVTTTAMHGGRSNHLPMDLGALGEAAIVALGDRGRQRPSLTLATEPPKFDFEKSNAKLSEQFDTAGVSAALNLAADTIRQVLRLTLTRQANTMASVDQFFRVQDEELQMLWWLTGQRVSSLGCAFDAVNAEAQPFVFASELADATQLLPGPPSIKALLSRTGIKTRKKVSVVNAVNGPDESWLKHICPMDGVSPVSTPIHYAIRMKLEIGGDTEWVPGWASATNIGADHSIPPLTLSELFYRERLLLLFG